jgi:hypothetical protein
MLGVDPAPTADWQSVAIGAFILKAQKGPTMDGDAAFTVINSV